MPCILAKIHRRFGGNQCLHLHVHRGAFTMYNGLIVATWKNSHAFLSGTWSGDLARINCIDSPERALSCLFSRWREAVGKQGTAVSVRNVLLLTEHAQQYGYALVHPSNSSDHFRRFRTFDWPLRATIVNRWRLHWQTECPHSFSVAHQSFNGCLVGPAADPQPPH
jgi:hypothetical protein